MATETDLARIDAAINEMSDPSESQCELLREHFESARASLLGEMREEYALNLRLASQALNCIASRERRERVDRLIRELMAVRE